MAWLKIDSAAAQKASKVSVTLSVGKSGKGQLIFSWPSALSVAFQNNDRCDVFFGDGEQAGKVMVSPGKGGSFKRALLKRAVVIRVPPPKGIALKRNAALADYTKDGESIVVTLPDFATPEFNPYLPTNGSAAGGKPGGLELNGTVLALGAKSLALSKHEAQIMGLLIERFGKCVSKTALLDHLYGDDPNGGAEAKIVDVWISKLRAKIEAAKIELLIVTHHGLGWELKRPVA